jgi:hypothetical protein
MLDAQGPRASRNQPFLYPQPHLTGSLVFNVRNAVSSLSHVNINLIMAGLINLLLPFLSLHLMSLVSYPLLSLPG